VFVVLDMVGREREELRKGQKGEEKGSVV